MEMVDIYNERHEKMNYKKERKRSMTFDLYSISLKVITSCFEKPENSSVTCSDFPLVATNLPYPSSL